MAGIVEKFRQIMAGNPDHQTEQFEEAAEGDSKGVTVDISTLPLTHWRSCMRVIEIIALIGFLVARASRSSRIRTDNGVIEKEVL